MHVTLWIINLSFEPSSRSNSNPRYHFSLFSWMLEGFLCLHRCWATGTSQQQWGRMGHPAVPTSQHQTWPRAGAAFPQLFGREMKKKRKKEWLKLLRAALFLSTLEAFLTCSFPAIWTKIALKEWNKKNLSYFFQQTPLCHTSSCREFLFQTDDVMGFVSQRCNE